MWYACDCGHRERIWNSRDGVTPFGLQCPSCGGSSLDHVEFYRDTPAPDHRLNKGQRYFADGTAEDAVRIIERRIESFKAAGLEPPAEILQSIRRSAKEQTDEWLPGWPKLVCHA